METKLPTKDKWKAPAWMRPGVKVRIFKGRNYPVGIVGTVDKVYGTGNGVKAGLHLDKENLSRLGWDEGGNWISVAVTNLEAVEEFTDEKEDA